MTGSLLTRVRARVELISSQRARGLIQGRGRSLFKGSGEDFDDLKTYQPGDRISDIDWKATARSGEPLIKQFNEERSRHIAIVADTSAAMAATAEDGTSKRDAMVMAAGLVCWLAQRNGDLVSLVAGSEGSPLQLPSRSSDGHLELLLRTIQSAAVPSAGADNSGWLLERAFRITRRPTLMVIITDEAHPDPADAPLLRRLTTRHDLIVVRVADADPLLSDDLEHDAIDPLAPRTLGTLARTSPRVARDVNAFRAARRAQIGQMLDSMSITHAMIAGENSAVQDMIDMLRRREYRHARG